MKEITHIPQDKLQIIAEVNKKMLVDSIHPYPGQKLYELNMVTGELKEAEIKSTNASFHQGGIIKNVIIKENCNYVAAINIANAQKKFFKAIR